MGQVDVVDRGAVGGARGDWGVGRSCQAWAGPERTSVGGAVRAGRGQSEVSGEGVLQLGEAKESWGGKVTSGLEGGQSELPEEGEVKVEP